MGGIEPRSPARKLGLWLSSLVAAALLLVLVAKFGSIDLWPDPLVMPSPWLFVAACAMQIPYSVARAQRLRYLLDPLLVGAGERRRFDARVLYGSGLVSYPIVIMLPLRLGELSRPLLLARAREPGVGFTEAVSAIAVERVVDGLIVVGMLFFGLAFAGLRADEPDTVAFVRGFGRLMAITFVFGLGVLLAAAARPALLEQLIRRLLPSRLGERAATAAVRVTATIAALFDWRCGVPLLLGSVLYWCLTVSQLWLVLLACGLDLGFADAAAIVGIIGLAIQLPGGPAQAGSFQLGAAAALGLLTGPEDAAAASSFAALMYLLAIGGSWLFALPGAWLLARARRGEAPDLAAPEPASAPACEPEDAPRPGAAGESGPEPDEPGGA